MRMPGCIVLLDGVTKVRKCYEGIVTVHILGDEHIYMAEHRCTYQVMIGDRYT